MQRPWMPLYVGDYLAKTGHLTTLQHGAYLLLIFHYWANGGLPTRPEALMAIARMTPKEWSENLGPLEGLFMTGWRHRRLDEELMKAKSISKVRSLAGRKGGQAIAKQLPTHSQSQSQSHKERKRLTDEGKEKTLCAQEKTFTEIGDKTPRIGFHHLRGLS